MIPPIVGQRPWNLLEARTSLAQDEYEQLVEPSRKIVFHSMVFHPERHLAGEEKVRTDLLRTETRASMKRLRLGAFCQGRFAGWHFGRADGVHTYLFTESGFFCFKASRVRIDE